jgi:branched-chain amino acid transport system permease protein
MASRALSVPRDPDGHADRESGGFFSRDNQILVVGLFALALYPLADSLLGRTRLGALEGILVYVILAMGLNIVVGYAGLLDLGYAAFFAIGAYTMGFLTSPSSYFIKQGWIPGIFTSKQYGFWAALAVSWIVAAIFGVLLGAPTLRLRGDYLAIVTLGFGEIVPNFFRNASTVTGGIAGINPIGKPYIPSVLGHEIKFGATNQRNWYYLMLVIALLSLLMIRRFYNSRLGRTWAAVREDEIAAASMGVNLVRTKLWAFALGASFAGFAGSIYSSAFQYVAPDQFEFSVSITILAMVILGGLGNIYGVVVGALLIGVFDRILAEELSRPLNWLGDKIGFTAMAEHNVTGDRFLVFGLALVLMMLLKPAGLISSARRKAEMTPESEPIRVHEQQQMYDIHEQDEPAAGSRA